MPVAGAEHRSSGARDRKGFGPGRDEPVRRDETPGVIADEARRAVADAPRMAVPRTVSQKPVRTDVTGVQAGGNDQVEPAAAKEDQPGVARPGGRPPAE